MMKIAKVKKATEFEVHSEAFSLLKDALGEAYVIRGEYHYRGCRFDLAIFHAETRDLVCTIEIKRQTDRPGRKLSTMRQIRRYEGATGKPCVLLHPGNLMQAIAALKERFAATTLVG